MPGPSITPYLGTPRVDFLRQFVTADTGLPDHTNIAADPQWLMQELAEELTFHRAVHHRDASEIQDEKSAQIRDALSELAQEAFEQQYRSVSKIDWEAQLEELSQDILSNKIAATQTDRLNQLLLRYSRGSSAHALVLFRLLVEKESPELRALGYTPTALTQFTARSQRALRSFIKLRPVLAQHQDKADSSELMGLFEDAILGSQSPLETFASFGRNQGLNTLVQWRSFLMQAAAKQLLGAETSEDATYLCKILDELKSLRIFNTLLEQVEQLDARRLAQIEKNKRGDLLQVTLDCAVQPQPQMMTLDQWLLHTPLENQILFYQDLRRLYHLMSPDAYANLAQKEYVVQAIQKKVDQYVFAQPT